MAKLLRISQILSEQMAVRDAGIANVRDNFLHQTTSRLVRTFGRITLEDLSVVGMRKGPLARTIGDLGLYEFRRQIEYKAEVARTEVVLADRFYPSSKTCFACKTVKTELSLRERQFVCECGWSINRDHNAAMNLEKLPRASRKVTPVEIGVPAAPKGKAVAGRRSGNTTSSDAK